MPLRCQLRPVWHVSHKPAPCQEICQASSLQPIQVRHSHVYYQPAICHKRGNTHNHHIKAATHCVKNKVQNQITSIFMIQVRRKETNLLVQNESCANNTQDRSPFSRVAEAWWCTPHRCDGHINHLCISCCGPASGCSTQPRTTEPTVASFPDWVASRCRALHERQH